MKEFLRKKNIIFSAKRYGIDALGAMAQGLFASLLIGTIISTLGEQLGIGILVTVGGYAKGATGAAMAISIGVALQCPPLVLFSLAAVGMAANELGGAGGPLAVLVVTIFATEFGKLVSKETKIDIIVTPFVTICVGVLLSLGCAPAIGAAASTVGTAIMWATELQPFFMGIIVSVIVGIALTLPISSAAICAALSLTGLAGGAAVAGCCAQMVGFAVMSFKENKWWSFCTGNRNLDAPDGKHCEKSENLASADTGICNYRSGRNLYLSFEDERCGSGIRNGNLRTGRTDWCVHWLGR